MKKRLLLIIFSCVGAYTVFAQSTCTQTLRTARSTYDQGRLHELPGLLEDCIRSGFTEQEKVEAYKLLTLAYIYLEEPAKADEAMLNILRTDSYFEINEATDPAEFIGLYRTFRTTPIYRLGGKIGANASQPNVVESVEANQGKSTYTYRIGVQVHIAAEIPLTRNLTLNPEIGFVQRTFEYKNVFTDSDTVFTTTAIERQSWLSLPISLQYQFRRIKYQPYLSLGVEGDYLLGSKISATRIRDGYQFLQQETFDYKDNRKSIAVSVIASAGARFRLGGGFVLAEIRYSYGVTDVNDKTSAFAFSPLTFKYGYADSIFKINTLSVTAGYVYNIFNPKKLRRRK